MVELGQPQRQFRLGSAEGLAVLLLARSASTRDLHPFQRLADVSEVGLGKRQLQAGEVLVQASDPPRTWDGDDAGMLVEQPGESAPTSRWNWSWITA